MKLATILLLFLCRLVVAQPFPDPSTLSEVGTVTVAWDMFTDLTVVGVNIYSGPASQNYDYNAPYPSSPAIATIPLFDYGINFITASSFDSSGLESDDCPEITYLMIFISPTNIVMITSATEMSTDLVHWVPTNISTLRLTNPAGNMFFRGSNATISMTQQ